MDGRIPWHRLEARVEPFYPKPRRGRPPYPLGVMLGVHPVQWSCNLSDPGMEDLLHEGESVRRFVGLWLSGALPDETTVLNFRRLWAWGDAGYPGAGKREENRDAEADGQVTMKAGKLRRLDKAGAQEAAARRKATVRAKVEHRFL